MVSVRFQSIEYCFYYVQLMKKRTVPTNRNIDLVLFSSLIRTTVVSKNKGTWGYM